MDQAAAERKLQEAVGFTYYPVGSNENWRDAAVFRLWNHAVSLQSQLSASEERVRALEDEVKALQVNKAIDLSVAALDEFAALPSPPQVIRG